ncbi:hypothetical protein EMCG_08395 [[Emmonsia] crescens]|uniref:Beta-lactamase-related domain-containing protein n=1 Tax=[Emmonsia] crescens TaxID=73230 RepID=A0A0G2I6P9_9EURO|nr:hypothetical protein EMCG_08395 [Emmonsia crescens UAMH 3008]
MKFNPVFTTAVGVLFTSLQICAAAPTYESNSSYSPGWEWDTCAPWLYCDVDDDCRIKPSCQKIAYQHDFSNIHCYVSFIHPRTCWAWTPQMNMAQQDSFLALHPTIKEIISIPSTVRASVGVFHRGQAAYNGYFGFRDHDCEQPPNSDTLYIIGYLSIAMLAQAIGSLVDEGSVLWDTLCPKCDTRV